MCQLCIPQDIKHLGSLESTQEAGVALGCTSLNFPCASYLDECMLMCESKLF